VLNNSRPGCDGVVETVLDATKIVGLSFSVLFSDAVSCCDLRVSAVDKWGIGRRIVPEENLSNWKNTSPSNETKQKAIKIH
jgi:hypothetical protein